MDTTWEDARSAFASAAAWFVDTAARARGREDEAGLGVWSVRDLVGHTSRSLLTVEAYLREDGTVEVTSPAGYYRAVRAASADAASVAQRGRDAGAALGDDVGGAVREIAERVLALVATRDADAFVATLAGGMRLADYLPTRTVELAVHTCDLAVALGEAPRVPADAARAALAVLADLAVDGGHAEELLLALTGRRPLPPGFTVL